MSLHSCIQASEYFWQVSFERSISLRMGLDLKTNRGKMLKQEQQTTNILAFQHLVDWRSICSLIGGQLRKIMRVFSERL